MIAEINHAAKSLLVIEVRGLASKILRTKAASYRCAQMGHSSLGGINTSMDHELIPLDDIRQNGVSGTLDQALLFAHMNNLFRRMRETHATLVSVWFRAKDRNRDALP